MRYSYFWPHFVGDVGGEQGRKGGADGVADCGARRRKLCFRRSSYNSEIKRERGNEATSFCKRIAFLYFSFFYLFFFSYCTHPKRKKEKRTKYFFFFSSLVHPSIPQPFPPFHTYAVARMNRGNVPNVWHRLYTISLQKDTFMAAWMDTQIEKPFDRF